MDKKTEFTVIGKDIPLKDAVDKVTGGLKYGMDMRVIDMLYGKILRSPHAHAKIKRINTQRAKSLPGVVSIITHADAPEWQWNNCWFNHRGRILDSTVRFVGDEIAAVAATSEDIAKAALKLIEVEYELLTPVFSPIEAMAPDAPQIRDEGNVREPYKVIWGDLDEGIRESDVIVQGSMTFGSQAYAPIGRNACVAEWDGDQVKVWTGTQTPSEMREAIAKGIGVPISNVRVIAQPLGCSFGLWWIGSLQMITVLLAKKVNRPVKIELDQEECFATVKRRHEEQSSGSLGCKKDGTLSFIDIKHIHDNGGYGFKPDVGFLVPDTWGRCPAARFVDQGVSTNRVTAGCMRGVGDVTLSAFVERLLDMAAIELDMDPIEIRQKNHSRAGDPLRTMAPFLNEGPINPPANWPEAGQLSSEGLSDCLIRGAEAFSWKDKWLGWGKPTMVDGSRQRGVGVAIGSHCCGTEDEYPASSLVRVHSDGSATLCCNMSRHGAGAETTQAQIAAEALGIPVDRIRVEAGDTDICPPNHGSIASNTALRTGSATQIAAFDARKQVLINAAKIIENHTPDDLDIRAGIICSKTDPTVSMELGELMSMHQPDSMTYPVIVGTTNITIPPSTMYTRYFAVHFVEVEVDIDTGETRLLDYVITQDSGTVLNPKVLANQMIGGAIQGSGFALHESLAFEPGTGKIVNPGFMDYKVLRASDFPLDPVVIFSEPYDPIGPFGAKSAGEAPVTAPIPAISQAIYNAIGVWVHDIPMTSERVLVALGKI